MASYKIKWKTSAKKELKRLDKKAIIRLLEAIESLANNPYPAGVKKLVNSGDSYRIRVGEYRIIYEIQSSVLIIYIIKIGSRQNIYK
ncbi:MAG: type II toxin-antitoxin system RelE/ParE family toxin [Crocosphaera sp.]|nr:type II toxin-antitoxin system RelE/ParE family toxin [Crocosphaera sp.]